MAAPIDVHAHYTPPEWIAAVRRDGSPYGCRIEEDADGRLSAAADRVVVSLRARVRAARHAAELRRRGYATEVTAAP